MLKSIFKKIKILILSITIFILSFHAYSYDEDEYVLNDQDWVDLYEFATMASVGIIFHEIGHLVIDEFNVPIFNNEEDVADSFMAWYLIHRPSMYDDRNSYDYWSAEPHKVLKGISDFYYYRNLLGDDYSDQNEYGYHSTDNKRFFNIACFMKGANPEVFDDYISKRNLSFVLKDQCDFNYFQMSEAWWNVVEGNGIGEDDNLQFWTRYPENHPAKIYLNFEYTDDIIFSAFNEYAQETIQYFLDEMQILFSENYTLDFEYCNGDINAYYISRENKILFCYELVEHFINIKYEVILLKNSL